MSNQAQVIEDIQDKLNWHWRNSMQVVRFFAFDSRSALPLPLLLVYFRPITLFLMVLSLIIFRYLERKGLTVPAATRNFRAWMVGADRPGFLPSHHKKFVDYG